MRNINEINKKYSLVVSKYLKEGYYIDFHNISYSEIKVLIKLKKDDNEVKVFIQEVIDFNDPNSIEYVLKISKNNVEEILDNGYLFRDIENILFNEEEYLEIKDKKDIRIKNRYNNLNTSSFEVKNLKKVKGFIKPRGNVKIKRIGNDYYIVEDNIKKRKIYLGVSN